MDGNELEGMTNRLCVVVGCVYRVCTGTARETKGTMSGTLCVSDTVHTKRTTKCKGDVRDVRLHVARVGVHYQYGGEHQRALVYRGRTECWLHLSSSCCATVESVGAPSCLRSA